MSTKSHSFKTLVAEGCGLASLFIAGYVGLLIG